MAGVLSVPLLLSNLGAERMGLFSLALGLFGFAGLFDLGLGRALTQTVARALGAGLGLDVIARQLRRTLPLVAFLGLGWGAALWWLAATGVPGLLGVSAELAEETTSGLYWLAAGVPILLLSSALTGTLEGMQRFGSINLVRIPLGISGFLVPVLVSYIRPEVDYAVASLVSVRLAGLLIWGLMLAKVLPLFAVGPGAGLDGRAIWRFGGWLTVSNLVGPIMVYGDRFYLASQMLSAQVALYTVPLDALSRATSVPVAAMNAFFPALAHSGPSSPESKRAVRGAFFLLLILWVFPLFLVALFVESLLNLWLGELFAAQCLELVKWLLIGIVANGLAHLPYALLQAAGRADVTARLHLIELPIYVFLVYALVAELGVIGAAVAWSLRAILDVFLLCFLAAWEFPRLRKVLLLYVLMIVFALLLVGFIVLGWLMLVWGG